MSDWSGKQIGKYQVKERLGQGGMGEVYKALHPTLERDVAIKLIHSHLTSDPEFRERFRREAKIVAGLRHPGIVQVHDFDVEGETFYMVMESVPGESLERRMQALHARGERMPLAEAMHLFALIAQAVAYAHSQGVVHRDLKPGNVLLTPQGQPVLVDFGISQIVGSEQLTLSGDVLGTPAYMSPEQCSGEVSDARGDVYTLGVILYELTTGVLPFDDASPVGLILKHISESPAPPCSINPDLPVEIEDVIQKAMAKTPAERFQSAQAMLETLETLPMPLADLPTVLPEEEGEARCPYRGLRAFEEEHAELFFGREALVGQLAEKLAALNSLPGSPSGGRGRFLAVLGASGSGKSSLVRAGLLPALRAGSVPGSADWAIVAMTPGERPLESLAAGLVPVLSGEEDRLAAARRLLDNLAADGRALHMAARLAWPQAPPEKRLLLVIDQFEEIFTLCHNEEVRGRFIENLLYAAAVGGGRAIVLLAMRADFYHRCAAYRDLASHLTAQQVLVGPLSEAELRRAIERPAQQVGLRFEPGLTEAILADVAQQPGALPLLQHALLELWERRQGRLLTLRAYQASGGVKGAIAQRAEGIYAGFSPQEQALVRRVMLRLTQPGEGTEDTRRRASLAELVPAEGEAATTTPVVQALADARLLTTGRDERGDEIVDVAHEALIRSWPRLRTWIDEDRAGLRIHRRLTEAAGEWERHGRDESYLYRGARLAEANEWAEAHAGELNAQEREFLDASKELTGREAAEREVQRQRELAAAQRLAEAQHQRAEEQARAAARLRRRALLLAGALLIAGVLAITALVFGQQADQSARRAEANAGTAQAASTLAVAQQATAEAASNRAIAQQATAVSERNRAEQQREIAHSRELAALAVSHLGDRLDLSFLLSAEAFRGLDSYQTHGSLLETLQASPHLDRFLRAHSNFVNSVAFSPDGKTLASGSADKTILLWDVASGQPIGQPLTGHTDFVESVAFSPECDSPPEAKAERCGKMLASGSWDKTIILWDVARRQPIGQPLTGHSDYVQSVAFSPDGKTLASGSYDKTIILWDVSTALNTGMTRPIGQPLTGHSDKVGGVAFSPDGKTLASGSYDKTIILWDVASRQPIGQPLTGHSNWVSSVAFSPDGKTLASGSADGTIILWDVASRQPIGQPLNGHSGSVNSVAFSPGGKTLASGGFNNTITLWDVSTALNPDLPAPAAQTQASGSEGTGVASRQPIGQPLTGHSDAVWSVAFSPDGKTLASGSADETVILWDVSATLNPGLPAPVAQTQVSQGKDTRVVSRQSIGQPLAGHSHWVSSVAFSPDGKTLASGSIDKTIILWDVASRQPIGQPLTGHSGGVVSVAFSPDGKTLASGSADKTIILWDVASGQPIGQPLTGHSGGVASVAFSPGCDSPPEAKAERCGKMLASGSVDKTIILWDVASGQPIGQPLTGHTDEVWSVAFSPDGKTLASGSNDSTIILWDVSTALNPGLPAPAAQTQASQGEDTGVAKPIGQPLTGHSDYVFSVAFSPDGKTLASGSSDETVILWDVASRQPIGGPLIGHSGGVGSVAFSPDSKTVASGSDDGTVILWDVDSRSWLARACRTVGRNFSRQEWDTYFPGEAYRKTCEQWPEGK